MTDWAVWPIFVLQLFAFFLFFFTYDTRLLGFRLKTIAIFILLISCFLIGLSLYHDSTEVLDLYF